MNKQKFFYTLQKLYLTIMMTVVGRALYAVSRVDDEAAAEIQGLPAQTVIEMNVAGNSPSFKVRAVGDGTLDVVSDDAAADLSISFKHMSHAFLVLSFQEGTAVSFTRDRMVADGELSYAIRLVRVLNRMEAIILPKFIAKRAVKRYPANLFLGEKISKAIRIYALVIKQLIVGN